MDEWKVRMISEYNELKERLSRLHAFIAKYEAGTLDDTVRTSIDILRKQESIMKEYLNILKTRGDTEGIDLETGEEIFK